METLIARRPIAKASWSVNRLLLGHSHNIDIDAIEAHGLEQVLGLLVDVELAALAVLREVEGGYFGHVLILALALFFLQLEGDAADGTALDTLHQVGCEAGDLFSRFWLDGVLCLVMRCGSGKILSVVCVSVVPCCEGAWRQ